MIQTIPLYDLIKCWKDALADSPEIESYCQTQFGRSLRIFVGIDKVKPPTESDCPYAVIMDGKKTETSAPYLYSATIGWVVLSGQIEVSGNVAELPGVEQCDALGQLIFKAIFDANQSNVATIGDYAINTFEFLPQIAGEAIITVEVTPCIGTGLIY